MGARVENLLSSLARRPLLSLTGGVSVASLGAHAASKTGIPVAHPHVLALILSGALIAYALRTLAHLILYLGPRSTALLRSLVGGEVAVCAAWYEVACHALTRHDPVLLMVGSFVLLVVIGLLGAFLTGALEPTDLVDASTRVEQSRWGEALQIAMIRLRFEEGVQLFGRHGSTEQVSACLLVLCVVLAFAGATAAPAAVERIAIGPSAPALPSTTPPKPTPTPTPQPRVVTTPSPVRGHGDGAIPAVAPTYEQLCGPQPTGSPAPAGVALLLASAFLREGAVQAGCAKQPIQVGAPSGHTWIMPGTCSTRLSSLAVAAEDGSSGMLLGAEAANIGFQLAAAGTLRAVSTRTPIRGGDAYTLSTTIGEYLIIRRRSSRLPQDEQATRCEELPLAASSYVLLPPQMASLWRALSRLEFTWPIRTGGDTTNVQLAFVADSPSRDPVATGSCHASRCSISLADGTVLRQHSERSR